MSKKIICPCCGCNNWTSSLYCDKCSASLNTNPQAVKQ